MSTVPVADTLDLLGQLQARGYPLEWVTSRIAFRHFGRWLHDAVDVPVDVHARIEWLADTFGMKNATREDGVHPNKIEFSRQVARNVGFLPPGHLTAGQRKARADARSWLPGFDRHGNFDLRYLPGSAWERDDTLCGMLRDALELTLHAVMFGHEVADATGLNLAQVVRMRNGLGLHGGTEKVDPQIVEVWPGARRNAEQVWQALDAADDVTLACLQQGMVVAKNVGAVPRTAYTPHIGRTHPAVDVFLAWQVKQQASAEQVAA